MCVQTLSNKGSLDKLVNEQKFFIKVKDMHKYY